MTKRLLVHCALGFGLLAVLASATYASRVPLTPAQQRARASVIFTGVALQNPTATGIQRFRVTAT